MNKKALVVIDIQNDITKHYRDIIENINSAVDWAMKQGMAVIYIKHNNLSAGTRTFKPDTKGAELVPELRIVSDHIFVKTKANALTSEAFSGDPRVLHYRCRCHCLCEIHLFQHDKGWICRPCHLRLCDQL